MARPATKEALIEAANEQFEKMWEIIDLISDSKQETIFNFGDEFSGKEAHWKRDKNLRDVLIHLYEWHQLLLNWIKANQSGKANPFLPDPYNWKTYGEMNKEFWEKHQKTQFSDSKKMLLDSHKDVVDIIEGFSDEELFVKKYFSYTGSSSLGSYCISATSSHYEWAIKKIKTHIKTSKKTSD